MKAVTGPEVIRTAGQLTNTAQRPSTGVDHMSPVLIRNYHSSYGTEGSSQMPFGAVSPRSQADGFLPPRVVHRRMNHVVYRLSLKCKLDLVVLVVLLGQPLGLFHVLYVYMESTGRTADVNVMAHFSVSLCIPVWSIHTIPGGSGPPRTTVRGGCNRLARVRRMARNE